ncbi:PKD-like domain-containing protein, partial [Flavobacterium sp. ARAG 55.4]|uniref:PKD-like domain-containing protein n=1 Tax=Flavobacterium sp. ARAG 55.4 TaxID=3451357 RepID=UPI003F45F187
MKTKLLFLLTILALLFTTVNNSLPNKKKIIPIRFLAFLILLFSSTIGYSQVFVPDGNYNATEYSGSQIFNIDLTTNSTCEVKQVYTLVKQDINGSYLLLGLNNGNGGQSAFRYYINSIPNQGMTSDYGVNVAGADIVIQIEANSANSVVVYKWNGSALIENTNSGVTAAIGDFLPNDGKFIEFKIPLSGTNSVVNICDLSEGGTINFGQYISFKGKSLNSGVCQSKQLDLNIELNGSISGGTNYCANTPNQTNLILTGIFGSVVRWESNNGSGWTTVPNSTSLTTLTLNNVNITTNYRAVIQSSICNKELITNIETITVESCCTTPVIANKTASICCGSTFTVTPVNGGSEVVPSGTTYSWTTPSVTGITGTMAGTNATNISGTLTNSTNAPVNVVYTVTPKSGTCTGTPFTVTVTVNPKPTATVSGTNAVCKDAIAPNITFTGASGTAPYTFTYKINGGSDLTITTTSGNSATVAVPTSTAGSFVYSLVSVKDASSTTCSQAQTGSATITVNDPPTATITGDLSACLTTTLTANTNATSPTYVWYKNNVVIPNETSSTLVVNTNGDYKVKITNGLTSCETTSAPSTVNVEDVTKPVKPILADVTGECTATATAPT